MIPLSALSLKTENWQQQLGQAYSHVQELLADLDLAHLYDPQMDLAHRDFAFRVPRHFASLMKKGDARDPLLLQVLPSPSELRQQPGYTLDPLEDQAAHRGGGVLHKYQGRVLLITTGACAINCRYCFRRHFPYVEHQLSKSRWESSLQILREDNSIHEVILSGGDPLNLSNQRLAELVTILESIPQLKRLRIHTRLPVVLPSRIDSQLIDILNSVKLDASMVLHVNHPQELSEELGHALNRLQTRGITLLNQSVLLKDINDSVDTQVHLCESLFSMGVLPYYLHQLDHVQGAAHFAVEDEAAINLHRQMEVSLPGYLLPRLVREIPGCKSKQTLLRSQNQ